MLVTTTTSSALAGLTAAQRQAASTTRNLSGVGERPNFSTSASTASITISTQARKLEDVVRLQSFDRAQSLLDVSLAAMDAQQGVLDEMRQIALKLADGGLKAEVEAALTARYSLLGEMIDDIARDASVDGRNLIGGAIPAEGGGDLTLFDGTTIGAVDLRRVGGVTLTLDPPGGAFVRPAFAENIIAAIPFEDGSGSAAAPLDWTIDSPSADLVNGAGWGTGRYGDGAVSLPGSTVGGGSSPHVAVRNIDFGNEVTFAFNIKVDNLSEIGDNGFMAFWETGNINNRVVIRTNAGTGDTFLIANVKDGVWTGVTGGPSFPESTWVHLAGTIAPDGMLSLYMDGQQIASGMTQPLADVPRDEIRIGATMFNSQGSVEGAIGDVVVYDRAFNPAEVNLLYQAAAGGVENWAPSGSAASWSHAAAEVTQAQERLSAVQSNFANAANHLNRSQSLARVMIDTADRNIANLIDFNAAEDKARLEANRVREQLAVAMLQSSAGKGRATLGLLSDSLNNVSSFQRSWRNGPGRPPPIWAR